MFNFGFVYRIKLALQNSKFQIRNSKLNAIFAPVNPVVARYTSYTCFHGAEPQFDRHINYSIFYYDHQLHQVARSIVTG